VIFARQPDGRVLVDREMLAATLARSEAAIRSLVRRRCPEPAGYLEDPTVPDRRHRRRAVYDLDVVTAAVTRRETAPA
jgi:hypothetical protein